MCRVPAVVLLVVLLVVGLLGPVAPVSAQTTDAPRLRISASPAVIAPGQTSRVCVRTQPSERVAVYAYTLPDRTYRLVRTGASASTLPCWAVRPGADTRLFAAPVGGPLARNSSSTVIQVRRPGSACAATAVRFSHDDTARCLFRAFVRGDRAMAGNYASTAVVRTLFSWRPGTDPSDWIYQGCSTRGNALSSSGVTCAYYETTQPGMISGVLIEFLVNRAYKVEGLETIG